MEQAQQAAEQEERRLARLIGDLSDKLDGEVKDRSSGDADCAKAIASEREERLAATAEEHRKLEEMVAKIESSLETALMEERQQREAADAALDSKCLQLQLACDEAQKWRIEQYNELVLELSKVTEMLTEETKSRQLQDQTLAGEVSRLRQETVEEANSRKLSINGVRDEVKDVLERLEREREASMAKDKERWQAITALKDEAIAEAARRDTNDETLRQLIDREVMQREEVLAGATRAWQKATIKTNEEWRASVRAETATREEAQLRLEQQLVEIRSAILETKAVIDQREEETSQRFKAASEALAIEDGQRKSGEKMLEAGIAEVKRLLTIEKEERTLGSQMNADNIRALEASLRDETLIREELDRRTAKEALEIVERLQAEQASREDADMQLDQRILAEVQTREELLLTEIKTREDADASVMLQWQKAMRDEVVAREEDRKDLASRIQQNQVDNQVERDDRIKAERDLMAAVARLQSLQKEEEETRVEQGERLGAAVESLQEAVRTLGPQREEILAKCLEAVDQVRNLLSKEVVTRSAKEEALQEAVREVRLMISDETQAREAEVKAVAESVVEERTQREDALARERRVAEEEVIRAAQVARKAREEEERRLQEKLLEVASTVSEERDLRQEALRQERQKNIDAKEELTREIQGVQRETTKVAKQLEKSIEENARRFKEVDVRLADLRDNTEANRDAIAAEVLKRETECRNLEQKALELQGLLSVEAKERQAMDADLRKYLDAEILARDESVSAERRARETGDLQLADAWKAAVRDERETREGELADVAKDLLGVNTRLAEENGKREDERSQQHLATEKLRSDIAELEGERKVDVSRCGRLSTRCLRSSNLPN